MPFDPSGIPPTPLSMAAPKAELSREQIDELQRNLQKLRKRQSKMRKTQEVNQDQIENILVTQKQIFRALFTIYQEQRKIQQTQAAVLERPESINENFLGSMLMKILLGGDSPLQLLMPKNPRWQ